MMIFQSCSVYKKPITLDEAVGTNTKAKIYMNDGTTLIFKRVIQEDETVYGVIKSNNNDFKRPLIKDQIKKVKLKDKTTSTLLSIFGPVVTVFAIFFIGILFF